MRLSDAIAMGRVLYTAAPEQFFNDDGRSACALGMAIGAAGHGHTGDPAKTISELWEWTREDYQSLPCHCSDDRQFPAASIITHIFDKHVFGVCHWTLDQLIDWVRQNEPPDSGDSEVTGASESPSAIVASVVTHPEIIPETVRV